VQMPDDSLTPSVRDRHRERCLDTLRRLTGRGMSARWRLPHRGSLCPLNQLRSPKRKRGLRDQGSTARCAVAVVAAPLPVVASGFGYRANAPIFVPRIFPRIGPGAT
jgi:hypothetical protein